MNGEIQRIMGGELDEWDIIAGASLAQWRWRSVFPDDVIEADLWTPMMQALVMGSTLLRPWLRWSVAEGHLKMFPLAGWSLAGADLRDFDLRGLDMRGADLRGATLRHADLRGADLRGADMRGADCRWTTDLRGADMRGALTGGTDFGFAYLAGVRL